MQVQLTRWRYQQTAVIMEPYLKMTRTRRASEGEVLLRCALLTFFEVALLLRRPHGLARLAPVER
jgi:hypothetical protein